VLQLPAVAESLRPTAGDPDTRGGLVASGAGAITAVGSDATGSALLFPLLARTAARSVLPASALVGV
jgi:hypothetical protein